jgi:hypothetical protein
MQMASAMYDSIGIASCLRRGIFIGGQASEIQSVSSEQRQETKQICPTGRRMGTQPPGMPSSRGFAARRFATSHNLNDLANDGAAGGRRRTSEQILNGGLRL